MNFKNVTIARFNESGNITLVRARIADIPNRIRAVEGAAIVCTCDKFSANAEICRHIRNAETKFTLWKRTEIKTLKRKALQFDLSGDGENYQAQPLEVLASQIKSMLGFENWADTVLVPLDDGTFAVSVTTSLAKQYSFGCGFGPQGQKAWHFNEWPLVGILELVSRNMQFTSWDWDIECLVQYLRSPTPLPPMLSHIELVVEEKVSSGGLFLLDQDASDTENQQEQKMGQDVGWARFWAAKCGLELIGHGWTGEGEYLPNWRIDGEVIGGLAIDLLTCRVKGIPSKILPQYKDGIPVFLQNMVGYTHLPWEDAPDSFQYQVIVTHPNKDRLNQNDNVLVLTANMWENPHCPHDEVKQLLAQVAGILLRMRHKGSTLLYHGNWHEPVEYLAKKELSAPLGTRWDVLPEAWSVLEKEVLRTGGCGLQYVPETVYQKDLGNDWINILPPKLVKE